MPVERESFPNPRKRQRQRIVPAANALQIELPAASARTGMAERTLRLWAGMGWKPVRRVGRKLLFSVADLEAWVAAGSHPPTGDRNKSRHP